MEWMAFAAAVAALAGVAALAVERALRLFRLPTRGVWLAAMAASLALPLVLPRPSRVQPGPVPAPTVWPLMNARTVGRATGHSVATDPTAPSIRSRVDAALPWGWAAGTLAMAAGLAVAALRLARRRRAWPVARMAGEHVLVSPGVGPAVVGFVRPRIVMPRWALAWAEPLQRLMLRHEREHLRAGDPLLLLAGLAAVTLAPWSPALWWQLRRLRLAVEVDCDARTLRATGDVLAYGRLLLEVGRRGAAGAPLPLLAFSEPRSFLERRITAMTLRTPSHRPRRALAWTALGALAAVSLAALPAPSRVPLLPARAPSAPLAAPVRTPGAAVDPDTSRVWALREVDRLPLLVNNAEVSRLIERVYPAELRDAGVEGTVTVEMVVGTDGLPHTPSVATATRDELRAPALAVVNAARFRPAAVRGHAVRVKLSLPIAFVRAPGAPAR